MCDKWATDIQKFGYIFITYMLKFVIICIPVITFLCYVFQEGQTAAQLARDSGNDNISNFLDGSGKL